MIKLCYCCGERIYGKVALIANAPHEGVDRVFLVKPEHVPRLDRDSISVQYMEPAEGSEVNHER